MAGSNSSQKNIDFFGTFLETLKQLSAEQNIDAATLNLVAALAPQGSRTVPELMQTSNMEFTSFAKALENACATGLVTLNNDAGQEMVHLTEKGQEQVQAQPPANADTDSGAFSE